jgi:acyl carrier protein
LIEALREAACAGQATWRYSGAMSCHSMTDDEIFQTLRPLCARVLSVEPADVTRGVDLRRELGADSLDLAELAMSVEDAFGLPMEEEAAARARTLEDVIGLIRSGLDGEPRLAGRPA